mgnify:CR=1 FL=1
MCRTDHRPLRVYSRGGLSLLKLKCGILLNPWSAYKRSNKGVRGKKKSLGTFIGKLPTSARKKIFKNCRDDLKRRVTEFFKEMNLKDPENYGHERSLIAILI